ncbi:MAG TPA: hypothetical protein VLX12_09565 [Syntrophorhabdales bacterium]|nr:hypothetical protein [Syntrophorhabdales bacterium]
MMNRRLIAISLLAYTLSGAWLLGIPNLTAAGPVEDSRNLERVGIGTTSDGQVDLGAYSKLAPWPDTDGHYLYSGCYDPAPLAKTPGATQCFMTIDLKEPRKPVRLATVYAFDPVASPQPPLSHPVWKDPKLASLPAKEPCDTFKDPDVLNGNKPPTCWDRGWNTHTHYVSYHSNVLAVNQERWRTGTDTQTGYHGVKFYDISDRAHPKFLSYWEAPVSGPVNGHYPDAGGAHHFNFDADGHYLYLGTEYKGFIGKILVILDVSDPRHPNEVGKWWLPGQKTPEEDASRDWVQQANFSNPVQIISGKYTKHVGMHYVTVYGNRAYLSYHQAGLIILDVSDKRKPRFISRLDYLVPGFVDPTMPEVMKQFPLDKMAYGNTHSARLVPGHQGNLLWVTDEYFACPYGHLRMVDLSDEKHPKIISHFLTDQNAACNGNQPADPTRFPKRGPSSHLGNVWGNDLLFMAWYGMGLRVINIADPYHPVEVGHYEYRIDRDMPPRDDLAYAGSDTYDVLFGPGGLLFLSDGTAGLRVLKYTGKELQR